VSPTEEVQPVGQSPGPRPPCRSSLSTPTRRTGPGSGADAGVCPTQRADKGL